MQRKTYSIKMGGSPARPSVHPIVPALPAVTGWVAMLPIFVTLDPLATPARTRVNAAGHDGARGHIRPIKKKRPRKWGDVRVRISINGGGGKRAPDREADADRSRR